METKNKIIGVFITKTHTEIMMKKFIRISYLLLAFFLFLVRNHIIFTKSKTRKRKENQSKTDGSG